MKNAKLKIFIVLLLGLSSCQTLPRQTASDELCGARDPASEGMMCSQVFIGETKVLPLLTSPEALVQYKETNLAMTWEKWLETDADYMSFYSKSAFKNGIKTQHASEIYGLENYKAFVSARDFLNRIPVGEFRLTRSTIMKTHDLGSEGIKKQSWLMGKLLPKNMSTGNSTGFKARTNVGGDPLRHPLSEDQYQALKSNPWISGFKELPWPLSRPNKRRGLIVYGDHRKVASEIAALEVWYHKNRDTMDPVALAAEFQYRFVSIHPFIDGNGRTAMLLANRILRERGYPGILQNFPNFDIYYSLKDWTEVVRSGVAEFAEIAQKIDYQPAPSIYEANQPDAARTSLLPMTASTAKKHKALTNMQEKLAAKHEWVNRQLGMTYGLPRIGSQQFTLLSDGFFYDFHGIPYVLNGRKLYPLTDRTYLLYAENGPLKDLRYGRRALTTQHRDVFRDHFKLLRDLEEGRVRSKDFEVVPYETIQAANARGELYLFPWQVELFTNAITIKDKDPRAILAHTRGYQTSFEESFHDKNPVSMAEVVAQYQYLEVKYHRYLEYADKLQNKEWRERIMQSRERYFMAAKELLQEGLQKRQSLPTYEKNIVDGSPRWSFLMKYIQHTNLAYPTLKAALAARGDKNIVLLRSDMASASYLGFMSNNTYLEVAKKLPGYDTFKIWLKKYVETPKEQREKEGLTRLEKTLKKLVPGFENLAARVHEILNDHPYDHRGVSSVFEREFVDHSLHAHDAALKQHISLSTSTDLYFNWMGDGTKMDGPFLAEGVKGKIFFVNLEKSRISATIATPYVGEFEILSQKRISPFRILEAVDLSLFKTESADRFEEINSVVDTVFVVGAEK